jgi:hypothetical protein
MRAMISGPHHMHTHPILEERQGPSRRAREYWKWKAMETQTKQTPRAHGPTTQTGSQRQVRTAARAIRQISISAERAIAGSESKSVLRQRAATTQAAGGTHRGADRDRKRNRGLSRRSRSVGAASVHGVRPSGEDGGRGAHALPLRARA